ncbi:MAG: acyl-CoA thioesterase [Myxococcales bacterium]|nr:acyl-CoA thioesterase [Myxococcales bacterium]
MSTKAHAARFVPRTGSIEMRVRYADTDKAAVVHHAAYLSFLEAGRIELFREHGFDYAAFERETGTGLPVIDLRVRYRAPARFDDLVKVTSHVSDVSRFSVWIRGVIERDGVVLVESTVKLACVGMVTEAPLRMPRAFFDALLEEGYEV